MKNTSNLKSPILSTDGMTGIEACGDGCSSLKQEIAVYSERYVRDSFGLKKR